MTNGRLIALLALVPREGKRRLGQESSYLFKRQRNNRSPSITTQFGYINGARMKRSDSANNSPYTLDERVIYAGRSIFSPRRIQSPRRKPCRVPEYTGLRLIRLSRTITLARSSLLARPCTIRAKCCANTELLSFTLYKYKYVKSIHKPLAGFLGTAGFRTLLVSSSSLINYLLS